MNAQLIPIIILFVLVAGAYFFIHKHASNKTAHPAPSPTVPPAKTGGTAGAGGAGSVGGGGGTNGAPRVEQK